MKRILLLIFSAIIICILVPSAQAEIYETFDASNSSILSTPLDIQSPCSSKTKESDGVYRQYYGDGNLYMETECTDDKQHGLEHIYYENGTLRLEQTYQGNQPHGPSIQYYFNGTIHIEEENFLGQRLFPIEVRG